MEHNDSTENGGPVELNLNSAEDKEKDKDDAIHNELDSRDKLMVECGITAQELTSTVETVNQDEVLDSVAANDHADNSIDEDKLLERRNVDDEMESDGLTISVENMNHSNGHGLDESSVRIEGDNEVTEINYTDNVVISADAVSDHKPQSYGGNDAQESEKDDSYQITENSSADRDECDVIMTNDDSHGGEAAMETEETADSRRVDDSTTDVQVSEKGSDMKSDTKDVDTVDLEVDKSDAVVKNEFDAIVKNESDPKDNASNALDEPRRLRKNRNPVARYGYDMSIKDELIDLDEIIDNDYIESKPKPKTIKQSKSPKLAKIEPQHSRGRVAQVGKPPQTCIVCKKSGKCKFNIVRNGDIKHLCDDKCFREFRTAPARYLKSESLPAVATATPPVPAAPPMQTVLTCAVCQVMNLNAKKAFISWNDMDMCSEDCLSKFKMNLGTCCAHCGSHITLSQRGNTTLKVGTELKQFCHTSCLTDYKKRMKICTTCGKDLAGNPDAFVAPVGSMNEFKDFCSPDCLSGYDATPQTKSVTVSNIDQRVIQPCAVCSKVKPAKHTVDLDKKKHFLCSAPCLSAFQYANKLSTSCDNCGTKCYTDQSPPQFIQFEGYQKRFCSTNCVNVFRTKNKKLKPCTWCRTKKINFDMIERVDANNEYQLFCSLNCLSLYRVNLQATSNQIVTCDQCKKIAPAQYHLTMSDASVRNFCSYTCVMSFQSAFNAVSSNGTVPQKGSVMANKQSTPVPMAPTSRVYPKTEVTPRQGAKADTAMPVISSVMSLAPAKPAKPPVFVKKAPTPTTPGPNKKPNPQAVPVTRQIVVQPAPPKEYVNKAIVCRPFVQTKATSCRPHNVTVGTQTDKELMPSAFVPIPVPIYVPVPMAMYNAPAPVVVPIPVPVPIPCFLPTTKKTTAAISRRIKEILENVPNDPLEAELLMMAEAVSSDKKEVNDMDDDDDDEDDEEYPAMPEKSISDPSQADGMSEDMLQMALRMATEMSGSVTDIEAHLSQKALEPVDHSRVDDEPFPIKPENRKRTRSGAPRRNTRRAKRSRADESPPEPPALVAPEKPQVSPDADYHLKFMYGVNAWKHWVVMKNQQISQLPRLATQKIRFFKTDLLQCTADEINYSLCLFVKEVCKPNGDKYAADSIYYLCLGIQQFLHENARIDNIFMDIFYERFTDCLNDVISHYEPTINNAGQLVCRIEEEHLWECKQLGAHSPQVLLNTLVYFNSKYFMLFSSDDHINLSFSHIMKHWKKTTNVNGAPGRCVYLRYQQPIVKGAGDAFKKKHPPIYHEQCENIENPLRCPVKLYEFYLSKCPDSIKTRNDVFYLVPERSCVPDSPVWYSAAALGADAMQKMLNRTRLIKEIQEVQLSV